MIFATGNLHKVNEVKHILGKNRVIQSLKDIGIYEDIPETGVTMHENALIKAQYVYDKTVKEVFAEDSGLEVMALNMEPGIYTARYAGPHKNNDDNIDKLLHKLQGQFDRTARFRAVVAYINSDGQAFTFQGKVNGRIAYRRMGNGGFGYDPVFIPYGHVHSFAQLGDSVKSTISHRARAMFSFLSYLNKV